MSKKILLQLANISGWVLLSLLVFYFTSGYAIVHKYGMDSIMNNTQAWFWHKYLTLPFLIFLFLHIVPYFIVKKQLRKFIILFLVSVLVPVMGAVAINKVTTHTENSSNIKQKENKTIKCPNCPKGCIIKEGESGKCGIYKNIDGKLQN